jgi:CO dehydrogenase/acetyl-CoA synthase beta subunit
VVLKSFFSSFARVVLAFEEKKGRRPPPLLASKTEAAEEEEEEEEEEEVDADAAEERSKDCPTIRPPLRHPSRVVVILLSFLLLCLACANITTKNCSKNSRKTRSY